MVADWDCIVRSLVWVAMAGLDPIGAKLDA